MVGELQGTADQRRLNEGLPSGFIFAVLNDRK